MLMLDAAAVHADATAPAAADPWGACAARLERARGEIARIEPLAAQAQVVRESAAGAWAPAHLELRMGEELPVGVGTFWFTVKIVPYAGQGTDARWSGSRPVETAGRPAWQTTHLRAIGARAGEISAMHPRRSTLRRLVRALEVAADDCLGEVTLPQRGSSAAGDQR